MKDRLNLSEIFLYIVIIVIGFTIMVSGVIEIWERDKNQREQIKILEQSLQEQIQEKQVYMRMLEEKGE